MTTLLKLRKGQFSLVEEKVHPHAPAVGTVVSDLQLPSQCVLTAIIRGGQLLLPQSDVVVEPGDEILAVAHASVLPQLAALVLLRYESLLDRQQHHVEISENASA